jgi:hypothetical protein
MSLKENVLGTLAVAGAISFAILFGVESVTTIPDNAHVVVDNDNTYRSDRCVSNLEWERVEKITVREAKRLKLQPNRKCINADGFADSKKLIFDLLGVKPTWE